MAIPPACLGGGRRQPSCGGTSRMMREYQIRICERLGVNSPGLLGADFSQSSSSSMAINFLKFHHRLGTTLSKARIYLTAPPVMPAMKRSRKKL